MASLSLPTAPKRVTGQEEKGAGRREDNCSPRTACLDLVVASLGDPVAADYAYYVSRHKVADCKLRFADLSNQSAISDLQAAIGSSRITSIVVFLNPTLTEAGGRVLDRLFSLATAWQTEFIGIVSTFKVHFGDSSAGQTEARVLGRAKVLRAHTVVFRPAHVLSTSSRSRARLRKFGFSYPLLPARFRGCCINGDELFAAIEDVRRKSGPPLRTNIGSKPPGPRVYTLLGPNRPWRKWLEDHRGTGNFHACLTWVCALLSLLCLGHIAGLLFSVLSWRWRRLRRWNFDTLRPRSFRELLAICNKFNYRHVKVVGYNNGVIHFGQRFPDKTVVSTVHCNRVVMTGSGMLKADCGATVRTALDYLAVSGKELPVVPNYSYVCLGTSFFVPIHGSAADFSTIADTITRVLLYDPARDLLISATRDETGFQEHVYNLTTDVLLLRLYLQAKPKSRYFVHRQVLQNPSGEELLNALRDNRATNVEIRKSRASSDAATVSKYYNDPGEAGIPVLELPRDTLGRLWDQLEENAVTSFLMHALTRHFAFHLELFFSAEDFAVFWKTHRTLPLRKIQLRYIRRDGLPHSAFRDQDCVAVDLFMFRRHRRRFEAYLKKTFTVVRTNPGKHSR